MTVYSISFDLQSPGRVYDRLTTAIGACGAYRKLQHTHWMIESNESAAEVRDRLTAAIESGDSLLVVRLQGAAAWVGLHPDTERWLEDVLSRA